MHLYTCIYLLLRDFFASWGVELISLSCVTIDWNTSCSVIDMNTLCATTTDMMNT